MPGRAQGVIAIEIELPVRSVSLGNPSRDKFGQRFADRVERQPHSARGRDGWYVASWWEFEAHRHESLGCGTATRGLGRSYVVHLRANQRHAQAQCRGEWVLGTIRPASSWVSPTRDRPTKWRSHQSALLPGSTRQWT